MSSLAQQLRSIQQKDRLVRGVPSGSTTRPSFLFTPSEAADLDDESILSLALSGLQELCTIDAGFSRFQRTILSTANLDWDPSLSTKSQQLEHTREVTDLLTRLSPHFLENSAHKVLEWMVRKWRVNEAFADILVTSILPFHDTVPFVRMLQIVYFTEDSKWGFLFERVKQQGNSISRTLLAQRVLVDYSLLSSVMTFASKYRDIIREEPEYKFSNHYIRFAVFLNLEVLSIYTGKEEKFYIKMFHNAELFLVSGRILPESVAGGAMLFITLCDKINLSEDAINSFLLRLLQQCTEALERAVIMTIIRTIESEYLTKLTTQITILFCKLNQGLVLDIVKEVEAKKFFPILMESLDLIDSRDLTQTIESYRLIIQRSFQ